MMHLRLSRSCVLALAISVWLCEAGEWQGLKWVDSNCGVSKFANAGERPVTPQIIDGIEAQPFEFPWQVFIVYAVGDDQFACGGTLISGCYVLTAAHCVIENELLLDAATYSVHVGVDRLSDDLRLQQRGVLELIPHPDFDDGSNACDIALLRLDANVEFTEDIRPICKPDPANSYAGVEAFISGWGIHDNSMGVLGSMSDGLRFALTTIVADNCGLDPKFMCTLDDTMADDAVQGSCLGDSGGPVAVKEGDVFHQVGVMSFINSAICDVAVPQGVTRITQELLDWIENC